MVDDEFAASVVGELAGRRPDIVALARVASVASIVEPALLRRLRLEVPGLARHIGGLDAGVEADLWFSQLAHVATTGQLTLRPEVAEVLRRQLGEPRHAVAAATARKIVTDAHRRHPDMVQLEERIIWSTVIGDAVDVGRALDRALATIRLGPIRAAEVVRWIMQARRRLPASAMNHPSGRRLLAAVAMYIDRIIPPELLAASRFPDSVGDIAPTSLPMTAVGVELVEGGARFVESDHPDAAVLDLPDTRPLVVEARWDGADGAEHSTVIVAEPGSATALADLAGPVVLRTIAGRRFRVDSTPSRQVVVAIFGPGSDGSRYESVDPAQITSLIQRAEVTVRIVDSPHDVYSKPEVLVVGPGRPTTPGFEDLAEAFVRAAERAHDSAGPNNPPGALVMVHSARDDPYSADLQNTFERHAIKVWDSRGLVDAEAAIASAVRAVIDHPERMYDLDLNTALTMLHSLALAFHSRYFHQEEVGSEAGELRLFDLGEDLSDQRERVARAMFTHVRVLCEYIFAGPTRSYLDGAEDPTQVNPRPRDVFPDDLADETGRQPHELAWSPSGTRWPSFHSYLTWFVQQLSEYAGLLRDRLGPRTLVNGYSVPSDALEACRLALGTAGLPPGHDEPVPSSGSETSETLYAVERARLPGLISDLATPVLAAIASFASERPASPARTLIALSGPVSSVAFGAPIGRTVTVVISGGEDGTVRLWDPATGTAVDEPLTGHTGWVNAVTAGQVVARTVVVSGGEDGTVRLWDAVTGTPVTRPLTGHTGGVRSVAFGIMPDGHAVVISGGEDGTVRLWDPVTGTPVTRPLTGHTGGVRSVAFGIMPDGHALAVSGGEDGTVRLWDPVTGTPVTRPLTGHTGGVRSVAFGIMPDGRALAVSGGEDRTVRLWDPVTGTPVTRPLTGHTDGVNAVAFGIMPDGRAVVISGGEDGTVRLWDPVTGTPVIGPLTGHTDGVNAVAVGLETDKLLLASGGKDGTVRLWQPTAISPTPRAANLPRMAGDATNEVSEKSSDAKKRPDEITAQRAVEESERLSKLGRYTESMAAIEQAVQIYRELARARPDAFLPSLAAALNSLSDRLSDLGRRVEALTVIEEAVQIYRELAQFRSDAFLPGLAAALNSQSDRLSDLGQRVEALTVIEEAVQIYRELAQARSDAFLPGLATALNSQSDRLSDLGRREQARTVLEEVVADQVYGLGPDHPGVLAARASLARLTGQTGNPGGARDQFTVLLPDYEHVLGPESPETLKVRASLAQWTGQAGDPAGARDQFTVLLPDVRRVLGPESPETLRVRASLAQWTGEAGDPAAARGRFRALLPDVRRMFGSEHPETLTARANLAQWTGEAGDPDAARDQFSELLPEALRIFGPEHPETLNDRANLSNWIGEGGDPATARDQFAKLLPIMERVLGPEHPVTLKARAAFARWTGKGGNPTTARDQFAELLPIMERVLGSGHPDTLRALRWTREAGNAAS